MYLELPCAKTFIFLWTLKFQLNAVQAVDWVTSSGYGWLCNEKTISRSPIGYDQVVQYGGILLSGEIRHLQSL